MPSTADFDTPRYPAGPAPKQRPSRAAKLLTRKSLDGRTRARRNFDAIANGIARDLGGVDHLSTIQQHLVEAFAGAAVHVHDLNARLMKGEEIDVLTHSQAISSMVRVASRIGIGRVALNASSTPSVESYLDHINAQREAAE